jgi:quercetin dioxygenase-like cupin family protein
MAATSVAPIALAHSEGETFWSFGALTTIKASGQTTGGRIAIIEQLARQGAGSPLHVHHKEDEWFYVLEGELKFWLGGKVIVAPAGSFVFGPRDIPHTFAVSSSESRFLIGTEPAGFEAFMRELSQPALTLTPPPPPTEPPDMEKIVSTAARYGIEILGPPGIPG